MPHGLRGLINFPINPSPRPFFVQITETNPNNGVLQHVFDESKLKSAAAANFALQQPVVVDQTIVGQNGGFYLLKSQHFTML